MTDRINSLTVVLEGDFRDDSEYIKRIKNAITLFAGVISVKENVTDHTEYVARERAKREYRDKLFEALG